jgi:mRNA interferase MazF
VTSSPYQPDRGDFIWLDFSPNAGTEQAGRRPALVISPRDFNIATGLVAVCSITNTKTGSKFEVEIPRGVKLTGVVQTYQFRTLDWIARNATYHSKANDDLMWEVVGRIEAILSIEP